MVIVTGAFGFIGVYLVDELRRQGYQVLATGRSQKAARYYLKRKVPFQALDITRRDDFTKLPIKDIQGVMHLAGLLPANVKQCAPSEYIDVNVLGTINVLDYCLAHSVPKIVATTSYADVQNVWRADRLVDADTPRNFKLTGDHTMYVISKNAATDCILHYSTEYPLEGIVFRLPPVYGYGPHLSIYADGKLYRSGFQIFIEKSKTGDPIEVWGDRSAVRDVVYVKDVVQAFVKAFRSDTAKGIYNISSGVGLSLEQQARSIIEVFSPTEAPSKLVFRPEKPNNITSYIFDIGKAYRDFGYQPIFDFHAMMLDYKKEEIEGTYDEFIASRAKL